MNALEDIFLNKLFIQILAITTFIIATHDLEVIKKYTLNVFY